MSFLIGNDEQAANTGKVSRHNTKNPVKSVSTGLDFAGFQYSGLFQICSRFFNMYYTLISSCNYLGSSISRAGLHKKTSVRTLIYAVLYFSENLGNLNI